MRLIDADALIVSECSQCDGDCHEFDGQKCLKCCSHNKCQLREAIDYADTINAVPVFHARWIMYNFGAVCSACNNKFYIDTCHPAIMPSAPRWHFCPQCGAKMDGEVE